MSTLRHLDLFSGIGGFALAVRWLGYETVGFCEIDPWCRKVLDKHWPEVPKHDDIRTLKGTEFGPIDLITGGFPCQPFSVAGQRRGEDDPRHLWPAMHRIIDTARPRFVLAENVAGIVNMALDGVLADLEAIGYTAGAVVIPAGAVNALHRRDRVWIMAHPNDQRPEGSQCAEQDGSARRSRMGLAECDDRQPLRHTDAGMADTECSRPPRPGAHELTSSATADSDWQADQPWHGSDRPEGDEAARTLDAGIDGLPPRLVRRSWADGSWEVGLPRAITQEDDRRQKLQAAGNAIVPAVAYEILRVMIGEAS